MSCTICGVWGRELSNDAREVPWLWHGYLAPGCVTLLTSQWKSGKTTLLSILLRGLGAGGTLAGLPLRAGAAIVVSEEPRTQWRLRHQKLNLDHVYFIMQPFAGKPSFEQWLRLIEHVEQQHAQQPVSLLAIDTLTSFLPGRNEAAAALVMEALLPLRRFTQRGISVLLMHHPAKGETLPGQAARGSGALAAFTDINLEMSWCAPADTSDRRRRILAFSRFEQTPRQLVIELNAEGSDYQVHGDFANDDFTQNWSCLRLVLEDANGKKTRQQLHADWPADYPRPGDATLYRWLQRAVAAALVCQEGTGRRSDPFRYWLPEREEIWKKDPLYAMYEDMERSQRETLRKMGIAWGEEGGR